VIERVDSEGLAALAFELVEVPSPTGDTGDVARLYGERLAERGMEVELLDEPFPATPIVVGRLRGGEPGPTVVLNGHLDTVPVPHEPARRGEGRVVGRGAADMKGALACAAEAARLVAEGGSFPGELVIVAIGLHEAPLGRGEDLRWLLDEGGLRADAAIVCELGATSLPVAHMGQATISIEIARAGMPSHELETPLGTPHPLFAAGWAIEQLAALRARLASREHEWVGAETVFLGEVHGGDFYNRFPTSCRLVGTRRWGPGRPVEEVENELRALLADVARETGCSVELDFALVREPYEIDPEHVLVTALREAYRDVTGRALPLGGTKVVADGAIFQRAGIPAVYHGPLGEGAHADLEWVEIAELERATKVYLRTLERLWG
jgi:acetylornithine deacetylase